MILTKVRNTLKKHALIQKKNKIVIGVSGGPDSVALLYLLNSLKEELKLKLHIAHLDHILRKDSSKDRKFVEDLAKKLNLPITCAEVNVKELAKRGSLEEIARNIRLGFLFKVAKDVKADKIALGHNLDDQAETVLMRILRGTGLSGLSAILPKRDIAGYQIIRPLIEIRRSEIEAYLRKKRIKPRRDPTNSEDIYFRNKIRNKLIPLLEKDYNRNIKELLSKMAEGIAFDYDYLAKAAKRVIAQRKNKLALKKLLALHPAIRRISLRLLIKRIKGDTRRITFKHIEEIEDLVISRPINSIVDLPKGVSVIKKKTCLIFYKR